MSNRETSLTKIAACIILFPVLFLIGFYVEDFFIWFTSHSTEERGFFSFLAPILLLIIGQLMDLFFPKDRPLTFWERLLKFEIYLLMIFTVFAVLVLLF